MRTLAGYTDKISVCPGDTIAFKVSAEDGSGQYAASLVRLHCVDSHRDGPGLQEEAVASAFEGNYPARRQQYRHRIPRGDRRSASHPSACQLLHRGHGLADAREVDPTGRPTPPVTASAAAFRLCSRLAVV